MNNYQIKVVEPGAIKLLEDMASKNLIEFLPLKPKDRFKQLLSKMRSVENIPSMEKITKEVESVRDKRHARKREN